VTAAAAVLADAIAEALTGTPPPAAGIIPQAQDILGRARRYPWPDDDRKARKDIGNAVWTLASSLKAHSDLRCGIIRAHDELPGLTPGPGALDRALAMVAEDVQEDALALVAAIAGHCGSEAADYVQNGTGEIASLFPAEGGTE
jgi:hypothetical protein